MSSFPHLPSLCTLACAALAFAGCAGELERRNARELEVVEARLAPAPGEPTDAPASPRPAPAGAAFDGSLEGYLVYAYEHSPELRASYEQWRAATERPRASRDFPALTLSYGYFIRAVETRVGPQNHRLGARQWFPWPTTLTASSEAEALAARSAQARFEARALEINAQVARAYWTLWRIDRSRGIQGDQRVLLENLSQLVRVRVETGQAALSDLAQVNLQVAKVSDALVGLDEEEAAAAAELVRATGAPGGVETPVRAGEPTVGLPGEAESELRGVAQQNPRVGAEDFLSQASQERARGAKSKSYPSLGVGVDWIIVGDPPPETLHGPTPDASKDAVVATASIRIPLAFGAHGAAKREAEALGRAHRARADATRSRIDAEFTRAQAALRNHARRVQLYDTTLSPQAEAAFASAQAGYQSGRAGIADVLMAEKEWVDLRLAKVRAQADYAAAWAEFERVVGRPVDRASNGGPREESANDR